MNTTKYFAIVTAQEMLSHNSKSVSTGSLFNTESVKVGTDFVDVPYVTGNEMKGILRRLGMEFMATMLGLDPELGARAGERLGDESPLTLNRLMLLWNGGILTSDGGKAVNVDVAARLSELIPWLAVVGGCAGNQMIKGRISVHSMTLVCAENGDRLLKMQDDINAERAPEERIAFLRDGDLMNSARKHLQVVERTHYDDGKDATVVRFLPSGERVKLLAAQAADQQARQEDDDYVDDGRHIQMRYSVQTVKAGSRFFWRVDTFDLTPLMEDAVRTTLRCFMSRPYVGGHRARGMGLCHIEWLGWNRIEPARGVGGTALDFPAGNLYTRHLQERRGEIVQVLNELAA